MKTPAPARVSETHCSGTTAIRGKDLQYQRWKFGTGMRVSGLVDGACCLAHDNKLPNGEPMYDMDTYFTGWLKLHLIDELAKRQNPAPVRLSPGD